MSEKVRRSQSSSSTDSHVPGSDKKVVIGSKWLDCRQAASQEEENATDERINYVGSTDTVAVIPTTTSSFLSTLVSIKISAIAQHIIRIVALQPPW